MVNYNRKYDEENLLEYLRKLKERLGRVPKSKEMDKSKDFPDSTTYHIVFGSWNNALEKAGYEPNRRRYAEEELLGALKQYAEKNPDYSKRKMSMDKSMPHPSVYRERFESWGNAIKLIGKEVKKNQQ